MNDATIGGTPLGAHVTDWAPPAAPARAALVGQRCSLEPLDEKRHGPELYAANALDGDGAMWTYLPYGPFASLDAYRAWLREVQPSSDPLFYAIVDHAGEHAVGRAVGVASYLRIEPRHGCIEIGHLAFSPLMQRTAVSTEAMFLLIDQAFRLGYRRCEWKCNALNAASRAAAHRLGFAFEGVFHQHQVVKGRSRDTAWYAVVDRNWPPQRAAFEAWLADDNFDSLGRQRQRLVDIRAGLDARYRAGKST